jgi:hypothetical protein
MEIIIMLLILGLPILILIGIQFLGQKCLHQKCSKMARRNHSFCKECEKEAGIYERK